MKILFITDTIPSNSIASAVLFYRHFNLLKDEGHEISILTHELAIKSGNSDLTNWNIKALPLRKWWHPPYKPSGFLKWLRYEILYNEAKRFIMNNKPDIIVGYLNGIYYSGLAAYIAKKTQRPLAVFYHDSTEKLNYADDIYMQDIVYKNNAYIINTASFVWAVSPYLIYDDLNWKNKFKIVYPIPELIPDKIFWNDKFTQTPIIAYAGSLYNEILDTMIIIGKRLKAINGFLLFMTYQSDNIDKIKQEIDNIIIVEPKDTLSACKYVINHATAFIVAYPEYIKTMPWIDSCFPSKFTQFIQTGIPTLVLAPEEAAIAKWCVQNNWIGYESNYDSQAIDRMLVSITDNNTWSAMAEQSILFSTNDFNPHNIQAIIKKGLQIMFDKGNMIKCHSSENYSIKYIIGQKHL